MRPPDLEALGDMRPLEALGQFSPLLPSRLIAIQKRVFLEAKDKKYQPFQTLIGDLQTALFSTCKISATRQETLNDLCFIKVKDRSKSSSATLMELVSAKGI